MRNIVRILAYLLFVSLIAVPIADARADDYLIKFSATIDKTTVPQGEALENPPVEGAVVTGQLLVSDDVVRDTDPPAGKTATVWINSVKQIVLEGSIAAEFIGGNVFVQDGQFQVNATKQYCKECKADGSAVTANAGRGQVIYHPARYLIVQSAPHAGEDADLAATLANAAKFSRDNPPRAIIMFAEEKSGAEELKFILSIHSFDLAPATSN